MGFGARGLRLFFSGIAGSGMSALALFSKEKGAEVSGSDRTFDEGQGTHLLKIFKNSGINIVPQDGSGIHEGIDLAVFSTAVEPDRPEVKRAKASGIKIMLRPEYLRATALGFETIAVSGTSGKSTTSGMLAFAMQRLGLSPNFIGGGKVKAFRSEKNPGNFVSGNSDILIIEACESDGTLGSYKPMHSIILSLALDHHPVGKTLTLFKELAENTEGVVCINADDENLLKIKAKKTITFSLNNTADFRAEDIKLSPLSSEFSVMGVGFRLPLPGIYNIYNALSVVAVLSAYGVPLSEVSCALEEFTGIERRFDIHLDDGRRLVIDDYAHNPHKIAALMSATSKLRRSICYIFQPHGFGPTRLMKDEYIKVFNENLRKSDSLIVLPILYKGGTVARDISSKTITDALSRLGKQAEAVSGRDEVIARLREHNCYVVMGARDDSLSDFAGQLAGALR